MTSQLNRRRSQKGTVLLVALIAVLVVGALAASMVFGNTSRSSERSVSMAATKALYVAEAGMSEAIEQVTRGNLAAVQGVNGPNAFGGGVYTTEITDNGDDTVTVLAQGTYGNVTRATQVVLELSGEGIYASALFAGNSSGDAAYQMKFGGTGTSADAITGNIYSGGNIQIAGTPSFGGLLRAAGTVSGGTLDPDDVKTGASLPIPDIASMNYATNNDYNVKNLFASATYTNHSGLGGKAWQVPESNPAHIFRKNPNDRTANTSTTTKDDYFLEDPYESVNTSSTIAPSHGTRITLSGHDGNPGSNGSNKVYYIDGNLWIHNNNLYNFTMYNGGTDPVRVTFVVKGNVYFSDNIMYQGNVRPDGVAFMAIKDSAVADSGNIYFGDPSFGTLERMDAFMYAENNFYDNNLSASGSAKVTVNGNMTAGNQVLINRDYGTKHSKLTVNFDGRILDNTLTLPGLPAQSGATPTWSVRSWNEVGLEL